MIGGGNYLEFESLACWAGRAQPTPKHVVYGATDLLRWDKCKCQCACWGLVLSFGWRRASSTWSTAQQTYSGGTSVLRWGGCEVRPIPDGLGLWTAGHLT